MATPQADSAPRYWIVSPWFDLCFVINFWWVLAFLPLTDVANLNQSTSIEFWQIYFLTAPHRWITLLLVSTDPDRRDGRGKLFAWMAIITAAIVAVVWFGFENFTCLILVDFIWNAWHFASQHGGVLRIYGRMGGGGRPVLERWGFRIFVTYTALRTAGSLAGFTENYPWAGQVMNVTDYAVLVLPVLLVGAELIDRPAQRVGKLLYVISVVSMYTVLLFTIRARNHSLLIAMSAATAAFHSVEYFAVLTFYAWRRREVGSACAFRRMASHWGRILAIFLITFGIVSQHVDRSMKELYVALNLWAAFLHYAYDGMIWKLRRKQTATTLNVQVGSGDSPASDST